MDRLIGRYSNRNRLQIWFTLIVFSICAWCNLNPLQFHLLDVTNIGTAVPIYKLIRLFQPFHIESATEIALLLTSVFFPTVLYIYFKRVGAKYLASATFFWFAYAAQNGFRLFNGKIFLPVLAQIMFLLSLLLLVMGLLKCLHNSDIDVSEVFNIDVDATEFFKNENKTETNDSEVSS